MAVAAKRFSSIGSLINQPALNSKNLFTYYSPMLSCFDKHAQPLNLHEGVGLLDSAMAISTFNHSGIQVAQVNSYLAPIHYTSSKRIYSDHQFDFIVVHTVLSDSNMSPDLYQKLIKSMGIDLDYVIQRLGQPTSTFSCPDNYEFYVYSNHVLENVFAAVN